MAGDGKGRLRKTATGMLCYSVTRLTIPATLVKSPHRDRAYQKLSCSTPASRSTCMLFSRTRRSISLTFRRLYRDQLALTERHLDGLIDDANSTLKLLTSLADSFKA